MAVWRKGARAVHRRRRRQPGYLIRNKKIQQLTVDHSLAQALVEAKTITAAEAKDHRFRNVLWKYLGSKEVGEGPEVTVVPVQAGDRFLLCTDGLTGVVPDEQLATVHQRRQPTCRQCADGLGQLALDQGSRDNISCIVIEVVEGSTRSRRAIRNTKHEIRMNAGRCFFGLRAHASNFPRTHQYICAVGLMTNSGTDTRGGRVATNSTASATSSGFRIIARCSSLTGFGRAARIGVSISPG